MRCIAKHTKVDIPDEEWFCPKCGAGVDDGWVIDYVPDEAHPDCELLHDEDYIICENCGYETTGKNLVRRYLKRKDMVTCPLCRGKGVPNMKIRTLNNFMRRTNK